MAMDKYEFNMKATQMQKMMDQGDYRRHHRLAPCEECKSSRICRDDL